MESHQLMADRGNDCQILVWCAQTLVWYSPSVGWPQQAPAENHPDSKVHGANMGPTWGRQDPGGPHVGPVNLAIWAALPMLTMCFSVSQGREWSHCRVSSPGVPSGGLTLAVVWAPVTPPKMPLSHPSFPPIPTLSSPLPTTMTPLTTIMYSSQKWLVYINEAMCKSRSKCNFAVYDLKWKTKLVLPKPMMDALLHVITATDFLKLIPWLTLKNVCEHSCISIACSDHTFCKVTHTFYWIFHLSIFPQILYFFISWMPPYFIFLLFSLYLYWHFYTVMHPVQGRLYNTHWFDTWLSYENTNFK